VLEVLRTLGFKTGKDTTEILLPDLPRRVISPLLKLLKAEHRREQDQLLKKNRQHVDVLAQGAILAQDSTHVGSCHGRKTWAEVAKDPATTEAHAFGDGKPITGKAMLEHLETLKAQDRLPLVLATDNGSAYKEKEVQAWLHENQVLHLFSLPRTPQHNATAERGIGEGKGLSGLGKGVQLSTPLLGPQRLEEAYQRLNQYWPRKTKGGLTAAQLKQALPRWQAFTTRSSFYRMALRAIHTSTTGFKGRTLRKETREAIFRTLERFGLILRWRGELKPSYVKQDRIS
jgi:transposase InsO family protein